MITVKQLQYRIGATNDSFRRVMDDTIRRAEKMDGTLKRGIATIAKYGAAFSAMASGVMYAARRLVNDTTASATQIQKFAERSGVAAESIQALGYAAEQNFTSLEQLGAGLTRLARRTAEAAQGNMAYARSYEQMGISIRNKDGTIRNAEALFWDIAEAFESITDEGERARIALNLFGDSGYELLPLLSLGRKGIEELAEEAYGLGRVLSQENIERFVQYDAAVTKFRSSMQGVRNQLAISIIPIFNAFADGVTSNVHKVTAWISENRTLIAQAVLVSAGLIGIALALGTLVAGFTLATKAIGVVISILGFLLSPLGLVLMASGVLYTAWNANWLGMRDAVQEFWKGAKSILDTVVEWEKKVIKTLWEWTISGLDWISTEFIPWLKDLPQTIRHTLSWVVNGLADLREAAAIAVNRTVAWTVNLARGVWTSVSDWIDRAVTWTVSLARGAYHAVADWLNRSVTWTVNFVRGAVDAVVGWGERAVTWTVNLARGVWDSVSDWIDRGVTWTVNLVRGAWGVVAEWIDRSVTWTVNLARGTADAVGAWVRRSVTWTVNLARGAAQAVAEWIDRSVTWTVTLARGVATAVVEWIDRRITWVVDLARGASASVADWVDRAVSWTVNLVRGTSQAVADWLHGAVDWTINLAKVVASPLSRAAQWLLGWLEGDSAGTVQMTADGEVALNLREAAPGWGTTLEQWLQERLDGLMWSEITEERFNELTEELGEQADEVLRRVDDKFYQATPHKVEMAADFVLNIGTGVATFLVGRTLYDSLAAALGALMRLLGFVPGWIAGLGVAGYFWPVAIAGAITLAMVATFEALPKETQENLETFLNTDLLDVLKAAGGAIGAIVIGVGVGASGVAIALAAVLTFSIGLVKWEWVADKATDLWDSFMEWAKGVHDWLPGQPGYIRYPIQIIFQLLGLTFEDDIQNLPLEQQLEQALAKLEDEVRTYARLQASLEDAHPQARGYIQKAVLESRERANAYAEEVNRLRALIRAENERSGQTSSPGMERLEQLVGGPRLSEDDILALGTGNRDALLERLSTVRDALDDVEIAGDDAARAIAQVVDAIVAPDKHAHLRGHVDVLAEMATRLVAIGEAKGAPLTMAELADVMALLLSETSTLLGNAEAMQNPLRVTSAGYEELNRRGIELINTTEGLNRNLEAGLELFRLYSRLYGDATHAAGAYMLPGKAYRGAWDEPFYGPGTDIHGLTARDKMNAFDSIRDAFVFGGEAVSKAWTEGILLGESDIEQAADYIAKLVKLRWSGESPPPLGPLSEIDEGGKRIVEAWADGLLSARHRVEEVAEQLAQLVADYLVGHSPAKTGPLSEADTGARNIVASFTEGFLEGFQDLQGVLGNAARGIFNLIRTLFTSVFTWLRSVIAEHFPEVVEAFDKMMAEIEAGLEGVQRALFADDAADDKIHTASERAQQWARNIVTSLSDAIAYGRNLGDVFDNLARQIASMIIQAKILGPLMQWLRLPQVLDAIPTFHAGGMIEAQTASVMHTGGVVGGLAHNERLIIGEVGERVLSKAQNDKFERMLEEGMGGGKVDVTVLFQAVDAESFVSLARRNPQAITSVVVDNIMRNGEIRKLIQAVRG